VYSLKDVHRESLTRKLNSRKSWHLGISTSFRCSICEQHPLREAEKLLTIANRFFNNGAGSAAPIFAQFLKDSKNPKYTVDQINVYPTGTSAVQVVSTLAYAWISDSILNGARWPPIVFGAVTNIIVYVSLAIWDIPLGWKWACYYIMGCGFGLSGLCMAWVLTFTWSTMR